MSEPDVVFESISSSLTGANSEVSRGKMMSSPGLKYQNKVFAFYHKESMGFRLGQKFEPNKYKLQNIRLLSPFKSKPPLKGWFIVEKTHSEVWDLLSVEALAFTKSLNK